MVIINKNALNPFIKAINDHFKDEVVKYYNDKRNPNGLPSITGKIEGNINGITLIMKQIFGTQTKIEKLSGDIAKNISGKYDSYIIHISATKSFYFRSIIGEKGTLTDKDLTPAKMGLSGITLSKNNLDNVIELGLKNNSNLPLEVLELCNQLINLAKKKNSNISTPNKISDLLRVISSTDQKKIGKNFGEIVLAVWCLYNKPNAINIFFPKEENNPLADFVVNFTDASKIPPLNVSAKFEGGANASLKSIMTINSKPPASATKDEVKAFNAIMAVAYDKIIDGLLNAEKILQTPEYKALISMIGSTPTKENISKLVETALLNANIDSKTKWNINSPDTKEKYKSFLSELEPFYKTISGTAGRPSIASIPKIVGLGKGKYYHPIYYSFSVALANRFNTNIEFSSVLDKTATSIKAEQIYLDISNDTIKIKVKHFSNSKFEFAPGAFAYSADNVRMKVKMIK